MGTQKGNMGTQSVASAVPWAGSQLGQVLAWAALCVWSAGHFGLMSCPWVSHPKPNFPQPRKVGNTGKGWEWELMLGGSSHSLPAGEWLQAELSCHV